MSNFILFKLKLSQYTYQNTCGPMEAIKTPSTNQKSSFMYILHHVTTFLSLSITHSPSFFLLSIFTSLFLSIFFFYHSAHEELLSQQLSLYLSLLFSSLHSLLISLTVSPSPSFSSMLFAFSLSLSPSPSSKHDLMNQRQFFDGWRE